MLCQIDTKTNSNMLDYRWSVWMNKNISSNSHKNFEMIFERNSTLKILSPAV